MSSLLRILKFSIHIVLALRWRAKQICSRLFTPVKWHNLRSTQPISNIFGLDRGTPIDRTYTNDFLQNNAHYIKGRVCEIAENTYTKTFGNGVTQSDILHYTADNKSATIIGDLTQVDSLPEGIFDCFICTVTLNFIYDYKSAIKGIHKMLKSSVQNPNQNPGIALVTLAGLVPISKYDYDHWGDFWRFTDMGIKKDFEEVFTEAGVEIKTYGNVLTATAELQGISSEELTHEEIFAHDPLYPVLICIVAKKI